MVHAVENTPPRPHARHLAVVPAAHPFHVHVRTGFMPPQPPQSRLPPQHDLWERLLENATTQRLKLADTLSLSEKDSADSATWRKSVQEMPTLCADDLVTSELILRRAHHVLAFILHFYVHTLPPAPLSSQIRIPQSLSIPLLQVSAHLALPPVLTYSDTVLYNWHLTPPNPSFSSSIIPAHLHSQTTFTGTPDEEHFYLTSSRIELAGVAALSLLRSIQNAAYVGDILSLRRISEYLTKLAAVVDALTVIANDVRKGCDPAVFYDHIRPWFRGESSSPWFFEHAESAGLTHPTEQLSGPSAGQSTLIHALDIFLGIDHFSHSHVAGASADAPENGPPFLERMQSYMPRHHRAFLTHLKANPRPLRHIVTSDDDTTSSTAERHVREGLKAAYNAAVTAVNHFRDAHIRIATLYIINQARRVRDRAVENDGDQVAVAARGTGGTDLVPFLKGVRDKTAAALLKI